MHIYVSLTELQVLIVYLKYVRENIIDKRFMPCDP
jgi:hypothetical protein